MNISSRVKAYIIETYTNQTRAAKAWGVSRAYVSQACTGKIPPPKWMLDEMGLEKRVVYVPKGEK